jgi:hypothetical protein
MKKLAPLCAAIALAWSGGVLANAGDADSQSPQDSQALSPDSSGKTTQGFVLIQRNIYIPVDAEGKAASGEAIVIDRQDFVTAEELKAAQAENGKGGESEDSNGNGLDTNREQAPKLEGPAPSASPHASPTEKEGSPLGRGAIIAS